MTVKFFVEHSEADHSLRHRIGFTAILLRPRFYIYALLLQLWSSTKRMKLIAAPMSLIYERKSSVLEHFSAMPSKSLRIQAAIRDSNGINGIPLNMPQVGKRNEDQIYESCGNELINSNANGKPVSCIPDQL